MDIVEPRPEALQALRVEVALGHEVAQRRLDPGQELVPAHGAARDSDDTAAVGDLLVTVALVEARQELAHGKIPGAAEDDKVEGLDRDQTCSHESLLSQPFGCAVSIGPSGVTKVGIRLSPGEPLFDHIPCVGWVIMGWRPGVLMMDYRAVPLKTTWGRWLFNQFGKIVHHQMCAIVLKFIGIALARDADHKSEVTASPGLDARDGILDDNRPRRLHPE